MPNQDCSDCGSTTVERAKLPCDYEKCPMKTKTGENTTCNGYFCAAAVRKGEKAKPGLPLHTCPFAEGINNDSESLCNCCENCAHECAMDI